MAVFSCAVWAVVSRWPILYRVGRKTLTRNLRCDRVRWRRHWRKYGRATSSACRECSRRCRRRLWRPDDRTDSWSVASPPGRKTSACAATWPPWRGQLWTVMSILSGQGRFGHFRWPYGHTLTSVFAFQCSIVTTVISAPFLIYRAQDRWTDGSWCRLLYGGGLKSVSGWKCQRCGLWEDACDDGGVVRRRRLICYPLARALVFKKVRAALGFDLCKIMISGAAPITEQTLKFFMSLDLPIMEGYGMSESSGS